MLHTNTLALHPDPAQTRTTHTTYSHTLYILALLKHVRHTLHTHTLALHPGPAQTHTTHTTHSLTRSTSWPRSNTYDTCYILTHSLYILAPLKHIRHTLHTHSHALHPGPAQTHTTHTTYSLTRSTSWPCSNTYTAQHGVLLSSLSVSVSVLLSGRPHSDLCSSESLPGERRPAGRACVCHVSAEAPAAGLPPDDGASGPVPRGPAHGRGQPSNHWITDR